MFNLVRASIVWFLVMILSNLSVLSISANMKQPIDFKGSLTYGPTSLYLDGYISGRFRYQTGVTMDANNIPMVTYNSKSIYNPTSIAQSSLQELNYVFMGNTKYLDALDNAISGANWLVANQKRDGSWRYDYPFAVAGMSETLKSGWASAMAQGQAISLLVRVYSQTSNVKYLKSAKNAMKPFYTNVRKGGVRNTYLNCFILEEYPTISAPSVALNGWLFALFGIYDLAGLGDDAAQRLFLEQLKCLEKLLPKYYLGKSEFSAYHLSYLTKVGAQPHVSSYYHGVHILQLEELYNLTSSSVVNKYLNKFKSVRKK